MASNILAIRIRSDDQLAYACPRTLIRSQTDRYSPEGRRGLD